MSDSKILLVGKERVSIIKAYTHTYVVFFLKRKVQMEVAKQYVKTWVPKNKWKPKKLAVKKEPKINIQTTLNF